MDGPASIKLRREKVYSRREIEKLIAEGRKIIIVNTKVLKVDAWLKYHPGGDLAILHMIGRDATDEVQSFVIRHLIPFDDLVTDPLPVNILSRR